MEMSNSEPLKIGYAQTWDYHFTGSIDDLRIYDRAPTSSEVTQLYLLEAPVEQNATVSGARLFRPGHRTRRGVGFCKWPKGKRPHPPQRARSLHHGVAHEPQLRHQGFPRWRRRPKNSTPDGKWANPMLITEIGTAPQVVSTLSFWTGTRPAST